MNDQHDSGSATGDASKPEAAAAAAAFGFLLLHA